MVKKNQLLFHTRMTASVNIEVNQDFLISNSQSGTFIVNHGCWICGSTWKFCRVHTKHCSKITVKENALYHFPKDHGVFGDRLV